MSEFRLVVLASGNSELLCHGLCRKCHGLSGEVSWIMFYQVCVVGVICITVGVMICSGSSHKLSMVVDFKHCDLRCFMWSSIWIRSRVAAKLCGNMTLLVKLCVLFLWCETGSQPCVVAVLEFEVQLSQLSHIHDLSMFGPFLMGARIMQVVA